MSLHTTELNPDMTIASPTIIVGADELSYGALRARTGDLLTELVVPLSVLVDRAGDEDLPSFAGKLFEGKHRRTEYINPVKAMRAAPTDHNCVPVLGVDPTEYTIQGMREYRSAFSGPFPKVGVVTLLTHQMQA
jgi:hypothetical protein